VEYSLVGTKATQVQEEGKKRRRIPEKRPLSKIEGTDVVMRSVGCCPICSSSKIRLSYKERKRKIPFPYLPASGSRFVILRGQKRLREEALQAAPMRQKEDGAAEEHGEGKRAQCGIKKNDLKNC